MAVQFVPFDWANSGHCLRVSVWVSVWQERECVSSIASYTAQYVECLLVSFHVSLNEQLRVNAALGCDQQLLHYTLKTVLQLVALFTHC